MATADPRDLRMMSEAWGEEFFPTPPEHERAKDAAAVDVLRRGALPHLLACADEIDYLRRILSDLLDAHYSGDEGRARALRAVAREAVGPRL